MKVKVVRAFRDAKTKKEYKENSVIDLSNERVAEVQATEVSQGFKLIEVVEVKKPATKNNKKSAD